MKRLTTLWMTLMLMCMVAWADQTVTVSANSSDISEGLDLKVVAKLFAEAKNLEEFETMLNNPDSAFCNLDLNGDGEVDYLRVVETGEGNKRLIVLQAILAKDIYQDVASIYVEKDESNNVSVQVIGDEYVYGVNYIIEPVYVYRPLIYDWFWSSAWYAWHSPWYWGYWPGWWHVHHCWARDWYWDHCYAWHRHHHGCSFRPGRHVHDGYHDLHSGVTRRDYATAHPDRSFATRHSGLTNARDIQRGSSSGVSTRRSDIDRGSSFSRTFGSRTTAATRSSGAATRSAGTSTRSASTAGRSSGVSTRSTTATTTRSTGASTRSAGTSGRSTATTTRSVSTSSSSHSSGVSTRSVNTSSSSRTVSTSSPTRSVSTSSTTRSNSSYSGSRSSYPSSSSHASGSSYSGSSSRSSYSGGSSFSGGGSRSSSSFSGGNGASSRGGGGGSHSSRR